MPHDQGHQDAPEPSSARRPAAPSFDLHRGGRPLRWLPALLRVAVEEEAHRAFELVTLGAPAQTHPDVAGNGAGYLLVAQSETGTRSQILASASSRDPALTAALSKLLVRHGGSPDKLARRIVRHSSKP